MTKPKKRKRSKTARYPDGTPVEENAGSWDWADKNPEGGERETIGMESMDFSKREDQKWFPVSTFTQDNNWHLRQPPDVGGRDTYRNFGPGQTSEIKAGTFVELVCPVGLGQATPIHISLSQQPRGKSSGSKQKQKQSAPPRISIRNNADGRSIMTWATGGTTFARVSGLKALQEAIEIKFQPGFEATTDPRPQILRLMVSSHNGTEYPWRRLTETFVLLNELGPPSSEAEARRQWTAKYMEQSKNKVRKMSLSNIQSAVINNWL
jgi:hypothetical protein